MKRPSGRTPCPSAGANDPGFTLLEVMIVCALAAILLMLAVPGYQGFLIRAHRSAAIELVLAAAACEERIYARRFSYDTTQCLEPGEGHYELRFEPPASANSAGYVIVAEPLAAQSADPCGSLFLDQTGERGISGPRSRIRFCWEGR